MQRDDLRTSAEHRSSPASIKWIVMLTAYLWSSAIMVNVSFSLTDSGKLALYGSDIAALFVLVYIGYLLFTARHSITPALKVFASIYVAFFAYCASISALRLLSGASDLQSLLIPRANLVSSLILVLILLLRVSGRDLILVAYVFSSTLAVVAIPLALFDFRVLDIPLRYEVFGNLAVRTDLQLFLMPLLLIGLVKRNSWRFGSYVNWLFALNLGSLVFCAAITGARVNAVLVPVVILVAAVVALLGSEKGKARHVAITIATPVVVTVALLLASAPHNASVEYGLERIGLYSAVADSPTPTTTFTGEPGTDPSPGAASPGSQEPTGESPDGGTATASDESKAASTRVRMEVWAKAWDEFTNSVWFGTGLRQYEVSYDSESEFTTVVQPHNFILEYLTAYGLIGLVLWLLVILYWPLLAIRSAQSRDGAGLIMFGLSLTLVFGVSFFQPLMLNPQVLLTYYFIIATLAKVIGQGAFSREAVGIQGERLAPS